MHAVSTGTTDSECYLAQLCERSFLRLWSYPNLFRDQGVSNKDGHGKELCDLLVVCGNDVLIFSDKSCRFPNSGNVNLDWCRWYRRAIKKSADQIFGAERWLRQNPERVFIDPSCDDPFPICIPDSASICVHRIVVALGAKQACQQHMKGSGSLWLFPDLRDADHITADSANYAPFYVGAVDSKKGFVHVLDDVTLDIILNELDTVTDFIGYLTKKEELFRSQRLYLAEGEENLLANYLLDVDDRGEHIFSMPNDCDRMIVQRGLWDDLRTRPEFHRKKRADKASYVWDAIIEEFGGHILGGTIVGEADQGFGDHEFGVRLLALESRHKRRTLAESLLQLRDGVRGDGISFRPVLSERDTNLVYVFALVPYRGETLQQYATFRKNVIDKYTYVVASQFRECSTVVGIATEKEPVNGGCSFDLVVFQPETWTEEMEREVKQLQDRLGIFKRENLRVRNYHSDEYPEAHARPHQVGRKVGRNERCPCGSGVKFKKCCGRVRT